MRDYPDVTLEHVLVDAMAMHLIRKAAHYCQPVGDDRFRLQIEARYGVRAGQMQRGRPRSKAELGQ